MKIRRSFYVVLVAMALGRDANADSAFKCQVVESRSLQEAGRLEVGGLASGYVGQTFVVDRETGKMLGSLSNSSVLGVPEILDSGSKNQAFKVLTVYGPSTTIDYLTIQTYVEGERKPFLFVTRTWVMSGLCQAY